MKIFLICIFIFCGAIAGAGAGYCECKRENLSGRSASVTMSRYIVLGASIPFIFLLGMSLYS